MTIFSQILLLLAGLVAFGIAIYASFIEPYRTQVRRIPIYITDLPDSLEGFTICHLSDTHTPGFGRFERRLSSILSGLDIDIAAVTGDLVRSRRTLKAFCRLLESVKARYGIFVVPGNNDYRLKMSMSQLSEALGPAGVRFLLNEHVSLSVHGAPVHIIGVEDPYLEYDDLKLAMAGIADTGLKVLLAHSPDILMRMADQAVDLILAGHTHGGQIRMPLIGPLWLHCRYPLGIADGYFDPTALSKVMGPDWARMHLHVSRGLGGSGIRARFLCPPEVTVLTLHREFRK
jgi:uncharacterized protein